MPKNSGKKMAPKMEMKPGKPMKQAMMAAHQKAEKGKKKGGK